MQSSKACPISNSVFFSVGFVLSLCCHRLYNKYWEKWGICSLQLSGNSRTKGPTAFGQYEDTKEKGPFSDSIKMAGPVFYHEEGIWTYSSKLCPPHSCLMLTMNALRQKRKRKPSSPFFHIMFFLQNLQNQRWTAFLSWWSLHRTSVCKQQKHS